MPKLFHVVMSHATITFTDHDSMMEFVNTDGHTIEDVQRGLVLCESDVTGDEYDRVCKMRDEL